MWQFGCVCLCQGEGRKLLIIWTRIELDFVPQEFYWFSANSPNPNRWMEPTHWPQFMNRRLYLPSIIFFNDLSEKNKLKMFIIALVPIHQFVKIKQSFFFISSTLCFLFYHACFSFRLHVTCVIQLENHVRYLLWFKHFVLIVSIYLLIYWTIHAAIRELFSSLYE